MSIDTEPAVTVRPAVRAAARFDYIRAHYRVPAGLGARVEFEGRPGRVCGTDGLRVLIRLDGETQARLYHPTWNMIWLEENCPATRVPVVALAPAYPWQTPATLDELVGPQWSGV